MYKRQTYDVVSIELFLEVSGSTFGDGVPADTDSITVNVHVGDATDAASLSAADTSFTIGGTDDAVGGNFLPPIDLSPGLLDLNSDGNFKVVLDAGSSPTTAGVFGSSLAPGIGISGTASASVAVTPVLRIEANLIPVPEPTATLLFALSSYVFLRRRRAAR